MNTCEYVWLLAFRTLGGRILDIGKRTVSLTFLHYCIVIPLVHERFTYHFFMKSNSSSAHVSHLLLPFPQQAANSDGLCAKALELSNTLHDSYQAGTA